MRRLLVLRPEPGASATVERARSQGLDALAVPLFEVEPVDWQAPDPAAFDALLLTSANAIRCGGGELSALRQLSAHAVGRATAEAASEAGFTVRSIGEAGVDALLASLPPGLRLLHLCGEDRTAPSDPHHDVTALTVYRAKVLHAPELNDVRGSVAVIHSPRAGHRFAELVHDRGSVAIAAISSAAAAAAGGRWETVQVAAAPTDEALLALAARLCNKPQAQ